MKTNDKTSVVFMGSGPVAARSLELLSQYFEVEAVVTKPTTEIVMKSTLDIDEIYSVSDKNQLDDLFTTKSFKSQVGILIDFGIIVNKKIIDYFPKGIINSHFSLLPKLRGADPLSFAILEGEETTGVSLMLLVEAMDEGPLLHQSRYSLLPNETTPSLTDKLIRQSVDDLIDIAPKWMSNEINPYEQDTQNITPSYTRKLTKSDGILNFNKPARILEREVRAYLDWPKSRTKIGSLDVVVTAAKVLNSWPVDSENTNQGTFVQHNKQLIVFCGEDALSIERLKPAGKKEMDALGFLNGYGNTITKY